MKVLLINPSQEKVYGKKMMPAYAPLGLLYVGTVLKNEGHAVRLVDIDTEEIDDEKFKRVFKEFDPDAIGISSVTPVLKNALMWAGLAKRLKDVPVVLGGIHATIAPQEVLKEDGIDIVVIGEGEATAKGLFDALGKGREGLEKVKGIGFKTEGKEVFTGRRPLIEDLDSIPFPDRSLLKRPRRFMPPDAAHLPVATVMTSRGCPGDCTFCCTKQIFTRRFRMRSVRNILDEMTMLICGDGIREIHIADDTFTVNKQRVLELCDGIKRKGINVPLQFMNGLRANFVDKDILIALKGIGIKTVGYGVESGSEEVLRRAKKGISLDVTRRAFEISKDLGFETWAFLIFGLPGETEETIKETIKFTKELDADFAKFFILKPYPGSEVHAELEKGNLLLSRDYDRYGLYTTPVHRLPGLEPERMVYWQKRAFREFYLRPRKIISHLSRMCRIRSLVQFKLMLNDVRFSIYCMFKGDKS